MRKATPRTLRPLLATPAIAAALLWAALPRDPDLPALPGAERTTHFLPAVITATARFDTTLVTLTPPEAKPLPFGETSAALHRDLARRGFRFQNRCEDFAAWTRGDTTVELFPDDLRGDPSNVGSVRLTRPATALERAAHWLDTLRKRTP